MIRDRVRSGICILAFVLIDIKLDGLVESNSDCFAIYGISYEGGELYELLPFRMKGSSAQETVQILSIKKKLGALFKYLR